MPVIDETRKKYDRLRVICRAKNASSEAMWRCKCKCGKEVTVSGSNLRSGNTRSCGCLMRELAAKRQWRHGREGTAEYGIWSGIKARCYNSKVKDYARYGARGIRMCKRWRNSFANFYADVGPRPSSKHSIDRYPNKEGNYEPGNVRWATQSQQMLNTRNTRYVTIGGIRRPATEVAREHGIGRSTLKYRIRSGWTVIRACTQPTRTRRSQ